MMPVALASRGKGGGVSAVGLSIKHTRLIIVSRDAVAL